MKPVFYHLLVILAFGALFFGTVQGHDLIVVHNSIETNENEVVIQNDGSFADTLGEDYEEHIRQNLFVKNNREPCPLSEFRFEETPIESLDIVYSCRENASNLSVEDRTLSNIGTPVNKIYEIGEGENKKTFVGEQAMTFEIQQAPETVFSIFFKYLMLGLEHILSGLDHILFIIGFVLAAASLFPLLKSVTGFTVSHSVTLTLAATGILVISPKIVEPIIALSIIAVGLFTLLKIQEKQLSRFWLIFGFGLFHGLGFAGAISDVGFPKNNFIAALLGFNIGVELGQLAVVAVVYPILFLASKSKTHAQTVKTAVALIVVISGTFWLATRLIG
ncbi:MAG: HupE/UreJ family protein [Candidatus Diapherotrites archaeon]|uniref:HupE/UreJ family protein n=1 Tax=Candidatus Iainarchaeum sp. TaxID=3101447 RepID=A0A8T4L1B8_9ARCH|nr:HupE/UreJ family protein [Candidatus Diapherotrites archaeon]